MAAESPGPARWVAPATAVEAIVKASYWGAGTVRKFLADGVVKGHIRVRLDGREVCWEDVRKSFEADYRRSLRAKMDSANSGGRYNPVSRSSEGVARGALSPLPSVMPPIDMFWAHPNSEIDLDAARRHISHEAGAYLHDEPAATEQPAVEKPKQKKRGRRPKSDWAWDALHDDLMAHWYDKGKSQRQADDEAFARDWFKGRGLRYSESVIRDHVAESGRRWLEQANRHEKTSHEKTSKVLK